MQRLLHNPGRQQFLREGWGSLLPRVLLRALLPTLRLLQSTHPTRKLCRAPPSCLFHTEDRPNADLSLSYPTPSCLSCFPSLTPNSLLVLPPYRDILSVVLTPLPARSFPRPPFPEGGGGKKGRKVTVMSFFISCRKWLPPWAPTGTQNISAASVAGNPSEKRVRAHS